MRYGKFISLDFTSLPCLMYNVVCHTHTKTTQSKHFVKNFTQFIRTFAVHNNNDDDTVLYTLYIQQHSAVKCLSPFLLLSDFNVLFCLGIYDQIRCVCSHCLCATIKSIRKMIILSLCIRVYWLRWGSVCSGCNLSGCVWHCVISSRMDEHHEHRISSK